MKHMKKLIKNASMVLKMMKNKEISVAEGNVMIKTMTLTEKTYKHKLEYNKFQNDHKKIAYYEDK